MIDNNVISTLEARVSELIADHRRVADLCVQLKTDSERLSVENRSLKEKVKELDAELSRRQLLDGLSGGGGDTERAKARVNHLMREVNKCIALLGYKQ